MKERLSILALLAISLFLLVSAVSAEDIADDSNAYIEVSSEEQSVDNSQSYDNDVLVNSLEATDDSNGSNNIILSDDSTNAANNSKSDDSSKVPSKFTSSKI